MPCIKFQVIIDRKIITGETKESEQETLNIMCIENYMEGRYKCRAIYIWFLPLCASKEYNYGK